MIIDANTLIIVEHDLVQTHISPWVSITRDNDYNYLFTSGFYLALTHNGFCLVWRHIFH